MVKPLLQVDKRARSLDQALEEIVVLGVAGHPELFQNIVGFVVLLLVPAAKVSPVVRMIDYCNARGISALAFQLADKTRNPLAFVHRAHNFIAAPMMGKFAGEDFGALLGGGILVVAALCDRRSFSERLATAIDRRYKLRR
jgi:hypothetical protein